MDTREGGIPSGHNLCINGKVCRPFWPQGGAEWTRHFVGAVGASYTGNTSIQSIQMALGLYRCTDQAKATAVGGGALPL